MTVKKRLFSYLKPLRASLIVAVIFALLFVIAQISQPFLLGKALDASKDNNSELFNIYVFIALGLAVLGVISAYIFEVIVISPFVFTITISPCSSDILPTTVFESPVVFI